MFIDTMSDYIYVVSGIIVAIILAFAILLYWYRRRQSHSLIQKCMAIWAAQGPFQSGDESATAMRAAYQVVFGLESANAAKVSLEQHANSYDQDPSTWESLRQQSPKLPHGDDDEQLIVAKGYAAMEHINRDYLEEGGHKLEPAFDSNGNFQISYTQTVSDEEIDRIEDERSQRMLSSIGEGLVKRDDEEAKRLVEFLQDLNRASEKDDPSHPINIGNAYLVCLDLQRDDPDSELSKEFQRLDDALTAVTPAPPGEWSDTPGAHEQHLLRRRNNQYFPESRRSVTDDELEHAKKQDISDYKAATQWLDNLFSRIAGLPDATTYDELNEIRQDVEELLQFTFSMGELASDIQTSADAIRSAIVSDMRHALGPDNDSQSLIDEAEEVHEKSTKTFSIPILSQISRKDSPIPEDETIPAIISEPPHVIRAAMTLMSDDKRALIEYHGLHIMKDAVDNGHVDPHLEEKLQALNPDAEGP